MAGSGFSREGLARLDVAMSGYVDRGAVPGLVALASRYEELHLRAFGARKISEPGTMTRDSIFRISSMTKPVTAAATMILVDEGRLILDDPVDRLLPELANRRVLKSLASEPDDTVPAKRAITVRDLLTFTMGFGIPMAPPGTYPIQQAIADLRLHQGPPHPDGMPEPDEWMRRFGTVPLMHQPGEGWMYNTGADVLGVLIARASGQKFDAFLSDRIFEPLGMKDTAFSVPAAKIDRLATSYTTSSGTGELELYDEAAGGQWSRSPAFPTGGAGLVSTAEDYLLFARMLLERGEHRGRRLLAEASVEAMTKDQLTPAQKAAAAFVPGFFDNLGWGFGMAVVTGSDHASGPVGAYGWDGGLGTVWRTDPARGLVTVLLTQAAFTSPSPPLVCVDFWKAAREAAQAS